VNVRGPLAIVGGGRIDALTDGPGDAGTVRVDAGSVTIDAAKAGGRAADPLTGIGASSSGRGRAGDVYVRGRDAVSVRGGQVGSETRRSGGGGNVRVFAGDLALADGASVTARSVGRADAQGQAGNVYVTVDRAADVSDGAGVETRASGNARAGSVRVTAGGGFTMDRAAEVAVDAESGRAGSVTLDGGPTLRIAGRSRVAAESTGDGGTITLVAIDRIEMDDARLIARTGAAAGAVTIDPRFVLIGGGTVIDARSTAAGGGVGQPVPVEIVARGLLVSGDTRILTAAPNFTADNTVVANVEAPDVGLASPDALLRPLCGVRVADVSSFLVNSRGGLPAEPGGFSVPTAATGGRGPALDDSSDVQEQGP